MFRVQGQGQGQGQVKVQDQDQGQGSESGSRSASGHNYLAFAADFPKHLCLGFDCRFTFTSLSLYRECDKRGIAG